MRIYSYEYICIKNIGKILLMNNIKVLIDSCIYYLINVIKFKKDLLIKCLYVLLWIVIVFMVILDLLLGYDLLCIFNINFKFCLDLLYCWYINEF